MNIWLIVLISLIHLFSFARQVRAQYPSSTIPVVEWARLAQPSVPGIIENLVGPRRTDLVGNSYVSGSLRSSPTSLQAFVLKFSPPGDKLLEIPIVASQGVSIDVMDVDQTQNIIIAGLFSGNLMVSGQTVRPDGFNTPYVLKLSPTGEFQWIFVNPQLSRPSAIAVDAAGNSYIQGSLLDERSLVLIFKLDSVGQLQWSRRSDSRSVLALSFDTNDEGTSCFMGRFLPTIRFIGEDNGTVVSSPTLTAEDPNGLNYYIGKLNTDGDFDYFIPLTISGIFGSISNNILTISPTGVCRIVDSFIGNLTVGALQAKSDRVSSYFLKINPSGVPEILVTSSFGQLGFQDLACKGDTHCWTSILYPNSFTWLGTSFSGRISNIEDYALLKLDANTGKILEAFTDIGGEIEPFSTLALDPSGEPIVSGLFSAMVRFGIFTLSPSLNSNVGAFHVKFKEVPELTLCPGCSGRCCPITRGRYLCYHNATQVCNIPGRLCQVGFLSCGQACYNPNTFPFFQCHGDLLCSGSYKRCLNSCFKPESHSCVAARIRDVISEKLCPRNYQSCLGKCFNPLRFTCIGQFSEMEFLCPVDHLRCESACYLPSQYECIDGRLLPRAIDPNEPRAVTTK